MRVMAHMAGAQSGAMIASSGETVRISAPRYDRSQVRMSIPGRDAGESIAAR